MESHELKKKFLKYGFATLDNLIPEEGVKELTILYDSLLEDRERTGTLRSDLAGAGGEKKVERIIQVMSPSSIEALLLRSPAYERALLWAKKLLGDDIEMDFDMLINKAPFTDTPTPWHQDAAYWINMPDKRAVSCWIALDNVTEENGCMWFIPRNSDEFIYKHQSLPNGGALYCDIDPANAQSVPLMAGGCTFHDGFTLHFSKGNNTPDQRRALILNFRPKEMINLQRSQGVDHKGKREFRNKTI